MKQIFKPISIRLVHICISILTLITPLLTGCSCSDKGSKFVYVENGQFIRNGHPYYFIGANFWYGTILASEGEGGDRERLHRELDELKSLGIDNLRILVGSDGNHRVADRAEPTLQKAPGVYNDTLLRALDYLMVELSKRDMQAVLYLNNSWEWSGGYSQYLEWSGFGTAPLPNRDGWVPFRDYVAQFVRSDRAKEIFAQYVRDIVSRTNTITGRPYKEDPAIFSWQIGNEPRAFSDDNKELFAQWIHDVAKLIKSIDNNHMVSTGSEGKYGCQVDIQLCERIHAYPEVDYINIHIWPNNSRWVSKETMAQDMPNAIEMTRQYIDEHLDFARRLNKPIALEEFGFPRDNYLFAKETPTTLKDIYYDYVLGQVAEHSQNSGLLAGCNFWAWGGVAKPDTTNFWWKPGDDLCGDPPQEPQGLYSVFSSDKSTIEIIRKHIKALP